MRSTTSVTGQVAIQSGGHFTSTGFIAAIVGKWREYRAVRAMESVPYDVMKDIGFRATEQMNAK